MSLQDPTRMATSDEGVLSRVTKPRIPTALYSAIPMKWCLHHGCQGNFSGKCGLRFTWLVPNCGIFHTTGWKFVFLRSTWPKIAPGCHVMEKMDAQLVRNFAQLVRKFAQPRAISKTTTLPQKIMDLMGWYRFNSSQFCMSLWLGSPNLADNCSNSVHEHGWWTNCPYIQKMKNICTQSILFPICRAVDWVRVRLSWLGQRHWIVMLELTKS